jgi:hypothetical protein
LRDPLRVLGEPLVAHRRAVEGVGERGELAAGEARREHDVRRVVDAERRRRREPMRDVPAAHQLARAHVGRLGPRREADAFVPLDQQAAPPLQAELERERQAHRSSPTTSTSVSSIGSPFDGG